MCFIGVRIYLKIKGREENIAYFTGLDIKLSGN